jgi:hypothetical protein
MPVMWLCVAFAGFVAYSGEQSVQTPFFQPTLDQPLQLQVAPVAIRPVTGAALPKAPEPRGAMGYFRPFANEQRNSRVSRPLPPGNWKVLWQADLPLDAMPSFVLQASNRAMILGSSAWFLYDRAARLITTVAVGPGDVVLDPDRLLFYHSDPSGLLVARRFNDAAVDFRFFPMFASGYRRELISRNDQRILVVSTELPQMVKGPIRQPDLTVIEVQDLGNPIRVDEDRLLGSVEQTAVLFSRTVPLVTAQGKDSLAVAVPGHVYLISRELKITADLAGDFRPIALSRDESDRIYLLAQSGTRYSLWLITSRGERLMAWDAPQGLKFQSAPPIVGYDHRVYLLADDRVLSLSLEGQVAWEFLARKRVAGGIITSDDRLIASIGSMVVAFDATGEATILQSLSDDLVTPPILTENGELLVASSGRLYCFGAAVPARP